ncbi:sodium-independent sulfate anion transporter [Anabrus simplex]|uniref:sodium-independent sulfate anion transporter n=1 Tax=Anabrus simplex TaxID=316456 RepID=UPI0034DD81CB
MTKYKMKNELRSGSEVTLTSYVGGDMSSSTFDVLGLSELTSVDNLVKNNNNELNSGNNFNHQRTWSAMNGQTTNNNNVPVSNSVVVTLPDNEKDSRLHGSPSGEAGSPGGPRDPFHWAVERARRGCTRKLLFKRLPILTWLPQYTARYAFSDLVAGFTVGLTVIPQAIAYANVAGLPPQYGLYSSFMACFVYAIFGSCKDSAVGPTAIAAILTRENLHNLGPEFAVLLCFLSGCVELLMGILQLGFLIDFISGPVSVGFTSAAAIIIATTQIKDVLGLSISGSKFLEVWEQLFEHISSTRLWDSVLGFSCMAVLLLLRKAKDIPIGPADSKEKTALQKVLGQLLWFISTARNILVVVVCATMAYLFKLHGMEPFVLTGEVKAGLPPFSPPPFSAQVNNQTYTFLNMASNLGSATFVVPLLAILENIALAKVFSDGKAIDATQEMLAIGMCNIMSSFVSSMPVSGALSRGAVNHASGVATTFGGIYTGVIVILSLHLFTPYFTFIPKASLAAVIIAAVVFMVEFHVVKPIWRTKKLDLIPAFATFLSCLFIRLELGIVIGISINVLFLLYASARPTVKVEKVTSSSGCEYLLITPDRSLVFPSVEYVRNHVSKAGVKQGSSSIPVVIDSRHIQGADFTAAKGVKSLIEDFVKRNQPILFYNLKPSIVEIFKGVQPKEFKYCHNEVELNELLKEYANKMSHIQVRDSNGRQH